METGILIAILAGLGGMLGWGLADFFAKKTIDIIGDITSLAWGHIFGTLSLLIILFYQVVIQKISISFPTDLESLFYLLLFGVGQAVIYLLIYRGFAKGAVGVLSPIFSSFPALTAILSIVFFAELLTGNILIGLIIVFLGIIVINTDFSELRSRRFKLSITPGFKEIAIATVLAGLWTLFWDQLVSGHDWLSYTLLMYVFMTLVILVYAKLQNTNLKINQSGIWKFLFFIGAFEVIAYLAVSWGYSTSTYTSIVALLSGAFAIPTIILAHLFLKEKITLLQTIGSLVVIVGIMYLVII